MSTVAAPTAPTGAQLRALTRLAQRGHGGAPWYRIFGDVYTYLFSAVVAVVLAYQSARLLGAELVGAGEPGEPALDPAWLVPILAIGLAGPAFALVIRLGPIGVSAPGALWWLPTPADRSGLLRPTATAWLGGSVAAGLVAGVLIAALGGIGLVWAGLGGAGLAVLLVSVAVVRQGRARVVGAGRNPRDRILAACADAAILLAACGWLVLGFLAPPPPAVPGPAIAAVIVAAAVPVCFLAARSVGRIPGSALRARGARLGDLAFAARALDLRGVGRVLADAGPDYRGRSSELAWVRGRLAAVTAADLLALRRSPWQLTALLAGVGIPLALAASGANTALVMVGLVLGALLAANVSGLGARAGQFAPALDRALGFSAGMARLARLPLATLVTGVWAAVVLGLLPAVQGRGFDPVWWLLAAVLAPGIAAAGSITAYRKEPDWSRPLIITPQGAYPPDMFSAVALGPFLCLIATLPTILALLVGASTTVPAVVLAVQGAISLALVAAVSYVRKPKRA